VRAADPAADGPARRPRARAARLAPLLLAPSLAAAVAVLVTSRSRPPRDVAGGEIAWRGTAPEGPGGEGVGAGASARAGLVLRFYASRKPEPASRAGPGPLRLLGELPASGELRASRRDYLQLAYAGLKQARHLVVVGVDERGAVHRYHPRDEAAAAALEPAAGPRTLGRSLDLETQAAGRVRLLAAVSERPIDLRIVEAWARRAADPEAAPGSPPPAAPLPPGAFGGVLVLDP
jgi:hypothetical protein